MNGKSAGEKALSEKTIEQARRMLTVTAALVVLAAMGFALRPIVEQRTRQAVAKLTEDEAADADYPAAADSIATFQDERMRSRTIAGTQLNRIIDDERTDDETRREAQQTLMENQRLEAQETAIEGMVTALGFEKCVASVGAEACTVVVRTDGLTRQQAAQILDIACRETGMLSGNVKIIPVE